MRSKGAWDLLSLAGGGESSDGTTFPRVGLRGLGPLPCAVNCGIDILQRKVTRGRSPPPASRPHLHPLSTVLCRSEPHPAAGLEGHPG